MTVLRGSFAALLVAGLAACGGSSGSTPAEPAVVLASCNPTAQTGCSAGKKCTWLRTSSTPMTQTGAMACTPAGSVAEGGACRYGADGSSTGYDDCQAGLACRASPTTSGATGTCARICNNANVTSCAPSAQWACQSYAGYFDPGGSPSAGLCDAQCNPLTQVRLSDGAPACGSPNPAVPTQGCYGMPSMTAGQPTVFTCSSAGPATNTSDVVLTTPYINGCAPGYIPLLVASTGSTSVICVALCQPASTTLESHPTPGGTAPYTCAAKGAGGTHECRYWWWMEDAAATASPWSNGLGFCMDYTKYTDSSTGMPVPFPSCTTQSGTIVPPATTSAASDWGCVAK